MEESKWLPISELPEDENQWCLAVCWIQLDTHPIIIQNDAGTIGDLKTWRKYYLENSYTHFMLINPPKN